MTPTGLDDAKPAEWILGVIRGYRMLWRRGVLVFRPAPFTALERRTYDSDSNLIAAAR